MKLTKAEIPRYARHFPVIGIEGQERLKEAKVLCIGAGGLGSPVLQYLCAAGVGTVGIVDDDSVSMSNLHRQILFNESDIGQPKVRCAYDHLHAQNPHIQIHAYEQRLQKDNAKTLVEPYDIIVDGCDNYQTRYLINDISFLLKKPLVSGSIFQFQGQIGVFNYQDGPCYRCLYAEPPPSELSPNCDISGVLGVLPGIIGSIQAAEVIKLITGKGKPLVDRLLQVDVLNMQFKEYIVQKNINCPLCARQELSYDLFKEPESQSADLGLEIEPQLLSAWLHDPTRKIYLIDVREHYERVICNIGGELMPSGEFDPHALCAGKNTPIVLYCKMGSRSESIARLLKSRSYQEVYYLKGGILAWIDQIDSNLNRY